MGYFESNLIKIDNDTIKYNSEGQLVAETKGVQIKDVEEPEEQPSASSTYSSAKIRSLINESRYVLPIASTEDLGGVKVDGSTIYYADCNRTGPCRVSWGNTYSYSELSSRFKEKDYNYMEIYITSIQNPEEIYKNTPEEYKKQWLRRIKEVIQFSATRPCEENK